MPADARPAAPPNATPAPLFDDPPELEAAPAPADCGEADARAPQRSAPNKASSSRSRRNMELAMSLKAHLEHHWHLGREGFRAHMIEGHLEDLQTAEPKGEGEHKHYDEPAYFRRRIESSQRTFIGYATQRLRMLALLEVARQGAPVGLLSPTKRPSSKSVEEESSPLTTERRLSAGDFTAPGVQKRARRAAEEGLSMPEALLAVQDAGEWAFVEGASGPTAYGGELMSVFENIYQRGAQRRYLRGEAQHDPDAAWTALRKAQRALFNQFTETGVLPELLARPLSSSSDLASIIEYAGSGVLPQRLLMPKQREALG